MSLEVFSPDSAPVRWASVMLPAVELATTIADTDFVPRALRGNPGAIAACILYGDELGIGPIQALQSIDVIEGSPQPSAALARALILREGHSFIIHEATGTRCLVSGLRIRRPEQERTRVEWNLDMARSAGLLSKAVWQRYPRAMLVARASSELANQVFPDVMKGLGAIPDDSATAGEIATWDEQTEKPPPRKRVARKLKRVPSELPPPEPHPLEPRDTVDTPLPPELLAPWEQPIAPVAPDSSAPVQQDVAGPPMGATGPAPTTEPSPWPPLPPEQPDTKPRPPSGPMGSQLSKAYMAAWKGADIDPSTQRELRLAVTSVIVGRHINSSSELTHREGLQVVGTLAEVETGALAIVADADGAPKLISTRKEPEPGEF
jgi:hypothetical protein